MHRNCPLEGENPRPTYNIEEAETMGQVARSVPRIYAALEDRQADHQSTVVEIAGKIAEQSVSILIDPVTSPPIYQRGNVTMLLSIRAI